MRTTPRASIDYTDTEPIVQCRARRRARRRALIEQLHGSLNQSDDCTEAATGRSIKSSQSLDIVPESKQSNVIKLEPSTGPTLFLIQTTTNHSTTVTAIRIQHCASYKTRTGTAARKRPIQRQQHDIGKQAPRKQ
jgi:hypothetical protein